MGADIDTVHRPSLIQAVSHLNQRGVEETLIARPVRFRSRHQDRHRSPGYAEAVHFRDEPGYFGGLDGVGAFEVRQNIVAGQIAKRTEGGFRTDRGEGIAFQVHAQEGDAFFYVVGVHGFSLPGARIPPVPGLPNAAAFG